ncbi:DUF5412 family protein [Priestia endophytica]
MVKFMEGKKNYKSSKAKITLGVFSILLISIVYVIYWLFFDATPFLENKSPNKIHKIEIVEKGHNLLTSTQIDIRFKIHDKTQYEREMDIDNFLEDHTTSQYHIKWLNDDEVQITMEYENQTKTLEYNFDTRRLSLSENV